MTLVSHPIYKIYKTGDYLTIGKGYTGDHNGIQDDYVEILEDAVIPSHVDGMKVKALGHATE